MIKTITKGLSDMYLCGEDGLNRFFNWFLTIQIPTLFISLDNINKVGHTTIVCLTIVTLILKLWNRYIRPIQVKRKGKKNE